MTARSFVKRLGALMRYRKALEDMNKYPDATEEDLGREDTCIICREDMRPWDPSIVGAVERSRPKKLPCGHILHFGCLKGWLERQQVCPTCRRSVVIDGAGPNGAAAAPGPNVGGQPQAPAPAVPGAGGGAGAGAGAGNPGQPAGNLRVFQLGPIRLGFAQGNAENIHDLANQLRLHGANQPAAPAATPAPALPTPPANLNDAQSTIESMQAQLHDISNRIQQEMYALQTTQAELQTLHALTLELNRLRQIQPQATNSLSGQAGSAAVNAQFIAQQIPNHFQNAALHFPPSFARHGGTPYASAIPSGSHDLPEGVSIPPGWSLLPLHRLEGQPSQQHAGTPPNPINSSHDSLHQQHPPASVLNRHSFLHNPNGGMGSSTPSADANSSVRNNDAQHGTDRPPEPTTSRIQREPPNVAAPTPVLPQLSGSSHLLFANRENSSIAGNSASRNESGTGAGSHAADPSDSDDGGLDAGSGKGKAKAVTIEDVEDDESD